MKTTNLVMTSIFGALAAIMAVMPLSFPFPILPYLKFDLSELPIIIVFLLVGFESGLISSIIYWLILTGVGSFSPIGPAMKFASVLSMIVGIWLGLALYRRLSSSRKSLLNPSFLSALSTGILLGGALRILVMAVFNYAVIWILYPSFLEMATAALNTSLGISSPSPWVTFWGIMFFTAVFNTLHVLISVVPSYGIIKTAPRIKSLGGSWISKFLRREISH